MIIQCTKELLKNMKREPAPIPDGEPVDPLYTWNATLYRMGRNRMMVLQNSMTSTALFKWLHFLLMSPRLPFQRDQYHPGSISNDILLVPD